MGLAGEQDQDPKGGLLHRHQWGIDRTLAVAKQPEPILIDLGASAEISEAGPDVLHEVGRDGALEGSSRAADPAIVHPKDGDPSTPERIGELAEWAVATQSQ